MKISNTAVRTHLGFDLLRNNDKYDYFIEGVALMSRAHNSEVVEITGSVVRETASAILFILDESVPVDEDVSPTAHSTGIWFPFSQVKEIHADRLVVSRWISGKKGIEC